MTRGQLAAEVVKLRAAIRRHRDSSGHDLCWHHPELWATLPERVDPDVGLELRDGVFLRLAHDRPSRTLKNLLQEAAVPEWERDRLPLLFAGAALVWVPGVGQDCRFAAAAEEAAVMLRWHAGV